MKKSFSNMTSEEFKANILPYYTSMYRVAASVMRSGEEAADAVQEAVLRLWDKRNSLERVDDLKSYCNSVVRNICINIIQRRKTTYAMESSTEIASGEDVHQTAEWHDLFGVVEIALHRLPPDQRKVLWMSAFGGFSNAEIADSLGITQGNVRVILSRARNRLKDLFPKT